MHLMIVTVTQYLQRLQTCRRVVFDFREKIKLLWIFSFLSVKEKYLVFSLKLH